MSRRAIRYLMNEKQDVGLLEMLIIFAMALGILFLIALAYWRF